MKRHNKIHAIKLKDKNKYCLFFGKKYVGFAIMSDDGYYYYGTDPHQHGLWSDYSLRMIADKLDEINKPWNDKVNEYFDSQPETE